MSRSRRGKGKRGKAGDSRPRSEAASPPEAGAQRGEAARRQALPDASEGGLPQEMAGKAGDVERESSPSAAPAGKEDKEGWESLAEETSGGVFSTSPELEQALREAAEAVGPRAVERAAETERSEEPEPSELDETRDRLLRLQAEFENFRRRTLKEREEAHRFGHQKLVKELLPTVDNLDRAIDHARNSKGADLEGLLQGVELVRRELLGVLAQHGVSEIETDGQPFDPAVHESMARATDASVPENTIVQVVQKGYRLWDRLVRPARVIVSTEPEPEDAKAEDETAD